MCHTLESTEVNWLYSPRLKRMLDIFIVKAGYQMYVCNSDVAQDSRSWSIL